MAKDKGKKVAKEHGRKPERSVVEKGESSSFQELTGLMRQSLQLQIDEKRAKEVERRATEVQQKLAKLKSEEKELKEHILDMRNLFITFGGFLIAFQGVNMTIIYRTSNKECKTCFHAVRTDVCVFLVIAMVCAAVMYKKAMARFC